MKYLWLLLLLSVSLAAATVSVGANDSDISLLEYSDIFIQKHASYDANATMPKDEDYRPSDTNFITRGYTTDEAVWVRLTLQNDSNESLSRVIHIDNSILDAITLYEHNCSMTTTGSLKRPSFDGIIDFYFPVELQPHSMRTLHIKVLSNLCPTYFSIYLETPHTLWLKTNKRELILTFFMSIMITLLVFNSFIYVFTREIAYLYYILFLLFATYTFFFSYAGMSLPIMHFLGMTDSFLVWWANIDAYLGIYYMSGIGVFFALFFMEIANIARFRYLYRLYFVFIGLLLALCLLTASGVYYPLDWIIYLCTIIFLGSWFTTVYLAYRGWKNSLYLFLGLGTNIGGHVLFLLYNFGVYVPKDGYWYFYEISLAIEAFLFSIVLSKKLSHTKALENAIGTQKALIRELHHRVKNNLQFIVSLYRLKLKKHLSESGKEALTEAEQNIHSIGKIHEILYNQQNISELDAKEYFSDLVSEIKRGYPTQNIDIDIKGDTWLVVDHAIYCGLIVNELITNAIKYAFDERGGTIAVTLTEQGKRKTLIISDNGVGYDIDAPKSSFGLSLVEKLAKDELKGSISTVIDGGVRHTIEWS